MKKGHYVQIIFLAVIISLLAEILFGGYLGARLATLPLVRKFGIMNPQAPIVINRRETVRVNDSNDIHDASESVKSKLSTLVSVIDGQTKMVGAAINLTSDGLFLTGKSAATGDLKQYRIILQDGRIAPLQTVMTDPASNMVVVKAEISGVSVANIGRSKDAVSGQRILFIYNSLGVPSPVADPNFVTFSQSQGLNQIFDANHPSRGFGVQPVAFLVPGEAIVDLSGAVLAMWDGSSVVSADVMKPAFEQALARTADIVRPSFGFYYKLVGKTEAELHDSNPGAKITQVVASGPAQVAGLQTGDVMTKIGDNNIDASAIFEQLIEKYKPGDKLNLTVLRGQQALQLTLVVGALK